MCPLDVHAAPINRWREATGVTALYLIWSVPSYVFRWREATGVTALYPLEVHVAVEIKKKLYKKGCSVILDIWKSQAGSDGRTGWETGSWIGRWFLHKIIREKKIEWGRNRLGDGQNHSERG